MKKISEKDGIEAYLQPYDPEEFLDIPEHELPQFVGTIRMKTNPIFDNPNSQKKINPDKPQSPLETHRMVFLDMSDYNPEK